MKNTILTESPVSHLADGANPPLPDDIHLIETPTPIPLSAASCAPSKHGHGSGHELDVRKSRRFCRDFGEPVRSKDPIYDEFPTYLAKDLPTTPLSSSPPSPLSHDLLPPPSRSEVCNLFSEDETTAVREFLRIWGSNKRVKKSSSKLQMIEDEAPGTQSDDDYSWEAAEVEDDVGDSASCSMLLHEVSEMVGIPFETSTVEGQSSIASTPPGLDTLGRLIQDSHESSQISDLRSSYQSVGLVRSPSVPPDGAKMCDRTSTGSCHPVDRPLDVAPRHSVTSGLVPGSNPFIREHAVAAKPMDVPVIVALTSNEAYSADSCDDLVPDRQPSLRKSRSIDSNSRRRGQIFNVEKQVMHAVPSGVVDSCTSYVPTRDPPPLPPLPPPSESVRPVSALDRLEASLSRLKAHNSQSRKSSKADAPSENRRSSPFTTSRERKHHSSVAARLPDSHSGHGRHFSSPMADVTAHRHHRKPPRVETGPINARLKARDAKLYPYPENPELTIGSFMEMDVVPPPPPPRQTSRLGRVAARLSRGITNWGRNIGSRGKESS